MPKTLLQDQYTTMATLKKAAGGVDLPRARPRRLQKLPRACNDDGRRQIPVAEAGDGMRDHRWRLVGRRHAGAGGRLGRGEGSSRSCSSPAGAMAAVTKCRPTQLRPAARCGSAAPPPNGDERERVHWRQARGWRGARSPTPSSGTKGGDPAERGSSSLRSSRITIMASGEGGGAP
jgi:hypothetical protein